MKVVIVGTTADARANLCAYLIAQGYEAHAFKTGSAALLHDESYGADVAVIDRDLPDLSPREVAAHLRKWSPHAKPAVLFVTNFGPPLH